MKTLIITAHPSSKGFTHQIAKNYKDGAEKSGREVAIMDLYSDEFKQDYLSFEEIKNIPADSKRDKIQAKIKVADELIFIHPLWWWGMPAVMKNFVDQNITAGFAYHYEGSFLPKGLLKGKTASVFITCDGPAIFYKLFLSPFKIVWKYGILKFCGVRVVKIRLFDQMRKRNDNIKDKWLKEVYQLALRK